MTEEAKAATIKMAADHVDAAECVDNARIFIEAAQRKFYGKPGEARIARRAKKALAALEAMSQCLAGRVVP